MDVFTEDTWRALESALSAKTAERIQQNHNRIKKKVLSRGITV